MPHRANLDAQTLELFNAMGECVLGVDAQGKCLFASQPLLDLLLWPADGQEATGQAVATLLHRDGRHQLPDWDEIALTMQGGTLQLQSDQETFLRGNGTSFPAQVKVHAVTGKTALKWIVQLRDMTETNRHSKALHASVRSFRALFDGTRTAIFFLDRQGKVLDANRGATRMFGFPAIAFIGKGLEGLAADDGLNPLKETLAAVFADGRDRFLEYQSKGTQRRRFPAEINLYPSNYLGQQAVMAMVHDITERKNQENALLLAKAQAEEANRLKSQFIGNMSHELRTPMNGVIGMGEILLETELDDEQRDYANTILESARNLLDILNDILDYAALEAGRYKSVEMEYSPAMLVEQLQRSFEPRCRAKGLTWHVEMGRTDLIAQGDSTALGRVLKLLLDNAVKFTEQGSVTLAMDAEITDAERALLRVAVKDTGIGIAAEAQETIFNAFSQVDGAVTRKYGGTGIGLAVVRALVHSMHGTLEVESTPGIGSTFRVCVPVGYLE